LETERDKLSQVSKVAQEKCVELEQRVHFYSSSHEQMTTRLQKLEEDDKSRSARVFSYCHLFFTQISFLFSPGMI
jgi:hypothetical protein